VPEFFGEHTCGQRLRGGIGAVVDDETLRAEDRFQPATEGL
jgi:hypothetical protein